MLSKLSVLLFVCAVAMVQILCPRTGYARQNLSPEELRVNEWLRKADQYTPGNPDSAIHMLQQALQLSRKEAYNYGEVQSLSKLGRLYSEKGDYDKALSHFREGIVKCDTNNRSRELLAMLYNNTAAVYQFRGDIKEALLYYQTAIQTAERLGSQTPVQNMYSNISNVLNSQHQPTQALYYLNKAEILARNNGEVKSLTGILINKGVAYLERKEISQSRKYFKEALAKALQYKFPDAEIAAGINLGLLEEKEQNFEGAITYYENALKVKGTSNPYSRNTAIANLGKMQHRAGNFKKAEFYLDQLMASATKSGISRDMITAYESLSELYASEGNFKKAFEYKRIGKRINDSVNSIEKMAAMSQLEVKYRTAQKDKELAESQSLIKLRDQELKQKKLWITIVTSGLLMLILLFAVAYRSYANKQQLQRKKMELMDHQREISELRAIMKGEEKERTRIARELHDGIMIRFSAVKMNVSALAGQENIIPEQLNGIVSQLDDATGDLRKTAHNLMPDMLLEEGLVEALAYFCNGMQRNSGLEIHFVHLSSIPRLEPEPELAIYRIVQELLQNVIKHAGASKAIIQLGYFEGFLSVTVEDNGRGIDREMLVLNKGLGLKSIHARVQALGGNMVLESTPEEGTSINLEFEISGMIKEWPKEGGQPATDA